MKLDIDTRAIHAILKHTNVKNTRYAIHIVFPFVKPNRFRTIWLPSFPCKTLLIRSSEVYLKGEIVAITLVNMLAESPVFAYRPPPKLKTNCDSRFT